MTPVDPRGEDDLYAELWARARAWLPDWQPGPNDGDFGQALLRIAGFLSAEVTTRLNRVPEKQALGLLDWLGIGPRPGRAASVPVVFKLGDKATEPVLAAAPVRLQAAVGDASIVLETADDVVIMPGAITRLVAVDPAADAFYLPPPDVLALTNLAAGPTAWTVKSLAATGSTTVQASPGLGFTAGMIVAVDGTEYDVAADAKDGLVPLAPPLDHGPVAAGAAITRVATFAPFDGAARDRQVHALYLGDDALLNLASTATITLTGGQSFPATLVWQYYGKAGDGDPGWQPLTIADDGGHLALKKGVGDVAKTLLFGQNTRWIRATLPRGVPPDVPAVRQLALQINHAAAARPVADLKNIKAVANTASLTLSDGWTLPFGPVPRQFDAFYLACPEAFTKPTATVSLFLEVADATTGPMVALDGGATAPTWLFGMGGDGALHRWTIDPVTKAPTYRGAVRPAKADEDSAIPPRRYVAAKIQPAPIVAGSANYFTVDIVGGSDVWRWTHNWYMPIAGTWQFVETLPAAADGSADPAVAFLALGVAGRRIALTAGHRLLVATPAGWVEVPPVAADHYVAIAPLWDNAAGATRSNSFFAVTAAGVLVQFAYGAGRWSAPLAIDAGPWGATPPPQMVLSGDDLIVTGVAADGAAVSRVYSTLTDTWGPRLAPAPPVDLGHAATLGFMPSSSPDAADGRATVMAVVAGTDGPQLARWDPLVDGDVPVVDPLPGTIDTLPRAAPLAAAGLLVAPGGDRDLLVGRPAAPPAVTVDRSLLSDGIMVAARPAAKSLLQLDASALAVVTDGGTPTSAGVLVARVALGGPASGTAMVFDPPKAAQKLEGVPGVGPGEVKLKVKLAEVTVGSTLLLIPTVADPAAHVVHKVASAVASGTTHTVVTLDPPAPAAMPSGKVNLLYDPPIAALAWTTLPLLAVGLQAALLDWAAPDRGADFTDVATRQTIVAVLGKDAAAVAVLSSPWPAAPPLPAMLQARLLTGTLAWTSIIGDAGSNPALSWEYWNGHGWWSIPDLIDGTGALRHRGTVMFPVPDDFGATDVIGTTSTWIRARLVGGDYGREQYIVTRSTPPATPETQSTEIDLSRVHPPVIRGLALRYWTETPVPPTFVVTVDNGGARDQSDANRSPDAEVDVFVPIARGLALLAGTPPRPVDGACDCADPCDCVAATAAASAAATAAPPSGDAVRALYLACSARLAGGAVTLLFVVDRDQSFDAAAPLIVEAWRDGRFAAVVATDTTRGLGETGTLTFAVDAAMTQAELFGATGFWLRVRPRDPLFAGWRPKLRGVYLNAARAAAAETQRFEPVGSSDGSPGLVVRLARPPVLGGSLDLRVREVVGPAAAAALDRAVPDTVTALDGRSGQWVRWTEVADLADAGPRSRVYTLDAVSGEIGFGDGINGMVPPAGPDAILAVAYRRGGDSAADAIDRFAILNLVSPLAGVDLVTTADAAAGGASPETASQVLATAAARFRARDRIVSVADLEQAAVNSGQGIAQARVIETEATTRLIVIEADGAPLLGNARARALTAALLAKASPALAARLAPMAARRVPFKVQVTLAIDDIGRAGGVGEAVKTALSKFFHPVTGGEDGRGWPIGAVPDADRIAALLLDLPDVDEIVSVVTAPVIMTVARDAIATLARADIAVDVTVPA